MGSPKGKKSASFGFASYLGDKLKADGSVVETVHVQRALGSPERTREMSDAIGRADLVVMAFPLYVDSLPAPVIRTLELVRADRAAGDHASRSAATGARPSGQRPRLAAIVNCGFPEARHCDTALTQCAHAAEDIGFEWAGGLGAGMGGAVMSQPLDAAGGLLRNVARALDLAAQALGCGEDIPAEAVTLMRQPLMPTRLYTLTGNAGWYQQVKRNTGSYRLGARPYVAA